MTSVPAKLSSSNKPQKAVIKNGDKSAVFLLDAIGLNIRLTFLDTACYTSGARSFVKEAQNNMSIVNSSRIVAIGASTGGIEALEQVFSRLPASIPPILLVVHLPKGFTKLYAARLSASYNYIFKEAQTGDEVVGGQVLIAPAGKHMRVKSERGRLIVECMEGDKVQYVIPSADVLFESVANVVGNRSVGVILTGMGADGARGLKKMRECGAVTIGQDRETCVVYGMPKVAIEIGAVEHILPIYQVADKIISLARL